MTWVLELRQKMSMHTQVILQPECFKSRLYSSTSLLRVFISCSSRCRKVIPVNVSVFRYHSFLDCYTVPKLGALIFQGVAAALSKTTQRNASSEQKPASFWQWHENYWICHAFLLEVKGSFETSLDATGWKSKYSYSSSKILRTLKINYYFLI